jgi:uncharacterized protein YacL
VVGFILSLFVKPIPGGLEAGNIILINCFKRFSACQIGATAGALIMSVEFILRIVGMIVMAIMGVYTGTYLASTTPIEVQADLYALISGLVGALIGLVLTPFITTRPVRAVRALLVRLSAQTLVAGMAGLIVGLMVAALLAFPISMLPAPFGRLLPFVGVLLFVYFGVAVFVMRQNDMFTLFRTLTSGTRSAASTAANEEAQNQGAPRTILLDTSVIIDGRIADIARTGFLSGTLLIPRFVLNELQYIADSSDSLRRQRGRRGMEVLSRLQKDTIVPVRISDIDVEGVREVDDKLVVLARQLRCPILTNDYNLNRVAELQGVAVLNVNELANAVKMVLLPGEGLSVRIIQEGKEVGQGVGYLDDGTMVVVEDGRDLINRQANVQVTKVLQTAAGRMIFARLDKGNN